MSKTPKLRFKEFSGYWESKKLGKAASLVKDGTHGTHADVEQGPYLLSAKNIKDGKVIITNDDRKISDEDYKSIYKNYSLKKDDILISIVGTIGRVAVMPHMEYVAFQRSVAILRFNLDARYVYQYMNTSIFQNQLLKKQVVSAQPGIYLNDLKKLDINTPSKEEQEKIASFFSLIDDKISLQSEKVEALKDYKKGMMQKIFSRELRFKDDEGRDYPEWKNIELKEMLSLTIDNRGKTPPIVQNGIPLLEVNSLGGIYPDFNKISKFVDEETYNEWFRNHIQEGDLLFTTVGATGLVSLVNSIKSCIAQNIVAFRFKEDYSSEFMYNLFNYRETVKRIKSIEMGAVQPSVKVTQLIKVKFLVPSIEEQVKIGSTLSYVDNKIAKEQEKLDCLSEYKKGLLQQMFV